MESSGGASRPGGRVWLGWALVAAPPVPSFLLTAVHGPASGLGPVEELACNAVEGWRVVGA